MPSTVNGIGTSYVGRRNRQVRSGVCRSCRRSGALESYDTRLWFVVIFVPVIPLGRKRIIDQCPFCRRHYVASKDQYEVSRQLNISAARDEYREQPSPQTALAVHVTMLGFHDYTGAEAFRHEVLERFPKNAELNAALASHLEQVAQYDEAVKLYQSAFELRPDLPQARIPIARQRMRAGDLDEARKLLEFLLARGAAQMYSLAPLEDLAHCYQKARRHADALKLCEHIVAELPAVAQDHRFRKFVRASEKYSPSPTSILPERKGGWLGLFNFKNPAYTSRQRFAAFAVVILALVVIGLAVNNDYRRRNRVLHLINEFAQAANVEIDGAAQTIPPGQSQMTIGEGQHHAKISGPLQEELDFDVEADYFGRWFKQPAWVLNVGGAATLSESTIVYARNPRPSTPRLIVGEKFTFRPNIDYVFVAPPASLQLDSRTQEVTKTHLEWVREEPSSVFQQISSKSPDVALAFAESHLAAHPDDQFLLEGYAELGVERGQRDRIERFLKAGVGRRPVAVEWHRCYQELLRKDGRQPQVVAEYDALLKAEPQNGRLLYLRGRIDPDHVHSHDFYLWSTQAEPDLAWPWFAMAAEANEQGRWQESLPMLDKAAERGFDPRILAPLKHVARLATGGAPQLEQEYREQLSSKPFDAVSLQLLGDALAVEGKADEARQALSEYEGRMAPFPAEETAKVTAIVRLVMLYELGDFEGIRSALPSVNDPSLAGLRAQMLVAAGQLDDAARDASLANTWDTPGESLGMSVAMFLAGRTKDAAQWRERACKSLEHRGIEESRAAQFLRAQAAPSSEQVLKLSIYEPNKALLFAALAQRFPEARGAYKVEAEKLNVSHIPPYQLVRAAFNAPAAK